MTEKHSIDTPIESYDPELSARVYCIPEQQALRISVGLLLTLYALILSSLLPQPAWIFIAIPIAYGLAHAVLGYIEGRKGSSHRLSGAITALDIALFLPALWFDPLASTPTLLLAGLFFGLASVRHRSITLTKLTLWMLALAAVTLIARAAIRPELAILPLLASAAVLLLLHGLVIMFRHHSMDLRTIADLAPHDDKETGLATRSTLYATAQLLWPLAHRQNMPVSLLYAVVDPEVTLNDAIASRQLSLELAQAMASVAKSHLRGCDILVRYDRLRFVFILLDCPHKNADEIAQRLQTAFQQALQVTGHRAQAYISATWLPTLPLALDPMLSALHSALDRARQRGQAHAGAVYTNPERPR
ncbi:MAG: diguanylate cyclase [Paraperlucidibaca sp.]|jgi:GGDEF domain-containing protein|uniref:diguanylate cyclase domain-containing protein n=1 Tax=Paraperlucidibaca sp. TaxID=2708021 RepID=UPI001B780D37|nr:diguanylate cyclase [Paraperlucidibaca sp.]MBQ0722127.1 diguanylate cyclase [Paraperlucidibaca sp.]MBQ0842188.1 diguanylate cyclase [Paraperlucidibaca sp.]